MSVFSAGGSNESIGLAFLVDIDYTYFLIEEEIGALHKELASNYNNIIASRAREAIKNEAIFVTFTEYFQNRTDVEERFRQAVDKRWRDPPSLHCELDQFHLGRIQIPESGESCSVYTKDCDMMRLFLIHGLLVAHCFFFVSRQQTVADQGPE